MKKHITHTLLLLMLFSFGAHAQEKGKRFWLSGAARGTIYTDKLIGLDEDTVTSRGLNYGHTLVDLTANIKPNEDTYIRTTIRVRNEYGGFWGSGITFDMRELYVKGLIKNAVRYQIGDMNYRLTPFTFYNNDEELFENGLDIFRIYQDMLHYDNFYSKDHTWRQQGAATDFALTFKKGIDELRFDLFTSRVNPTNFANISERIFAGGNVTLVQSKYLSAGVNYVQLFDIDGTSSSETSFENSVLTGTYSITLPHDDWKLMLKGESGQSKMMIEGDPDAPVLEDYFNYVKLAFKYNPFQLKAYASFRDVGPGFRSSGAQMKRVNFDVAPIAYQRYGNDQVLRPIGLWDIYNDASIYMLQISPELMSYDPAYDNITPYGKATPNRRGFEVGVYKYTAEKRYKIGIQYFALSEIAGQGTAALRNFDELRIKGKVNVNKFFANWDKKAALQFSYATGSTTRTGEEDYESIDFKNQRFNIGFTWAFIENFELIAGYESHSANGFELIPERDDYTEVIDFQEANRDLSETLMGIGLKYHFNEYNNLQAIWQTYQWSDTGIDKPDFGIQRFALIYKMKF